MEIKVHLPPWPKLRLLIFLLLPLLAVAIFWLYLVVNASIFSLAYPRQRPVDIVAAVIPDPIVPIATEPAVTIANTSKTPATNGASAVLDNLALARQALADSKYPEAYAAFKLVVASSAGDLSSRGQLRTIALKLAKIDDLKKFYEEQMVSQPKEAAYPLSLGTIYMTVDRNKEKARELFELSQRLNPLSTAAQHNLEALKNY